MERLESVRSPVVSRSPRPPTCRNCNTVVAELTADGYLKLGTGGIIKQAVTIHCRCQHPYHYHPPKSSSRATSARSRR